MNAEDIISQLDEVLTSEQQAIRVLDANLAIAHAEKKLQLFEALSAAAKGRPELHPEVLSLARRARQNAMLLAFARDCIRDAMGTVARQLNTPSVVNRAPSDLRKGIRVSVTG
jgi:hypothetical protein